MNKYVEEAIDIFIWAAILACAFILAFMLLFGLAWVGSWVTDRTPIKRSPIHASATLLAQHHASLAGWAKPEPEWKTVIVTINDKKYECEVNVKLHLYVYTGKDGVTTVEDNCYDAVAVWSKQMPPLILRT